MRPRSMSRREVIALDLPTVPGRVVYLAKKPRWDGAWHTDDVNGARVYRHPGLALSEIMSHEKGWAGFNPRVLSAWKIPGYVDVPTAAVKRQREEAARMREIDDRMRRKP